MTTVTYTKEPVKFSGLVSFAVKDLASRYLVMLAAEVATTAVKGDDPRIREEQLVEASDRLKILALLVAICEAADGARLPCDDLSVIEHLMGRCISEAEDASQEHIEQYEEGCQRLTALRAAKGDEEQIKQLARTVSDARHLVLEDMAHAGGCRAVLDALKEVSR
jgi:hypothetical protein